MRGLQERRVVAALRQRAGAGAARRARAPRAAGGQAGPAREAGTKSGPSRASRARLAALGVTAAVGLGADQLTKSLAVHYLSGGPLHLVGPLSLALTYNSGAAFSIGQGLAPLLVVVGVALVAVLVGVGRTVADTPSALAIGLVLGGALGNLADRLVRANHGAVIDFIQTRYWPTFNLADACIVCGAVLLVVSGLRRRAPSGSTGRPPGREPPGPMAGPSTGSPP